MIPRRVVLALGLSQLVGWGVTYYLVGAFGDQIARDNGWTAAQVQGGFSLALVVMGLSSSAVGRAIDRRGGRPVMAAGSCLGAAGCLGVAAATSLPGRFSDRAPGPGRAAPRPLAATRADRIVAGSLYALTATIANGLNAAMSAQMIGLLSGLGLAASAAVWVSTLRGIGQSAARLGEVLFGRHLPPLDLNLAACALLPVAFAAGLWGGVSLPAACAFTVLYGAGNGVLTITRGTLPLVLFEPAVYGSLVGGLVAPSLLISAAAPLALVMVSTHYGEAAALLLCQGLALVALAAGLVLRLRFRAAFRPRAA